MTANSRWPAVTAAVLLLALSAYTMSELEIEDMNFDHEPQTEDPDRDVKDSSFSYKSTTTTTPVTNATKRPLQCFFCSYDSKIPRLRSCLDPIKFASSINGTSSPNLTTTLSSYSSVYKMMTKTCRSTDDECFTSVMFNTTHELVSRGCTSDCVASSETVCCKSDRCNNQSVFVPEKLKKVAVRSSGSFKTVKASMFFIVTIMLILQTALRVAFV